MGRARTTTARVWHIAVGNPGVIYVLTGMVAGVVIGGPVAAAMVFLAQGGDYLARLWSAPTLLVLCTGIALILAWIQFVLNTVNKWKSRRPLRKKISTNI